MACWTCASVSALLGAAVLLVEAAAAGGADGALSPAPVAERCCLPLLLVVVDMVVRWRQGENPAHRQIVFYKLLQLTLKQTRPTSERFDTRFNKVASDHQLNLSISREWELFLYDVFSVISILIDLPKIPPLIVRTHLVFELSC